MYKPLDIILPPQFKLPSNNYVITTLHNYIGRHEQRDLYFDNNKNNFISIFVEGIKRANYTQEECHNINGCGSQEMKKFEEYYCNKFNLNVICITFYFI